MIKEFVIGCAGFIGSNLTDRLLAATGEINAWYSISVGGIALVSMT